jgi:hypothetical protein
VRDRFRYGKSSPLQTIAEWSAVKLVKLVYAALAAALDRIRPIKYVAELLLNTTIARKRMLCGEHAATEKRENNTQTE